MQSEDLRILLALTLLLPIGCQTIEPEVQSKMHQVLGALQIPTMTERDSALTAACRECAAAGDIGSLLLGLPKISDTKQRDEVAEECVEMLAAADKKDAAGKVVELITDPTKRTELSAALTAG